MIIDLEKFVTVERPFWSELESVLNLLDNNPGRKMSLEELRRFHYLYERASGDLGRIMTFASEPEICRYLESLVARAYGEIHETREKQTQVELLKWFLQTWPQTFRRHLRAFWLSVVITIVGMAFGGLAMALDPEAKSAILPEMFASHLGDPNERVAREESSHSDHLAGAKSTFSASLMRNNISVAIRALAFGMTFGIGTIIVLLYNGIILGVIVIDYILAGQSIFLLGWLMPHGVIEIPAILIGGQAGLVLARALIGRGERASLATRLRAVSKDLANLIGGVALMLIWAGLVEAFLSQYHAPVIPYWAKIAFGTFELVLLVLFLSRSGLEISKPDSLP
jgi:uncharacterized membrane protein SpoIIM required for sporulation